MIAGLRKTDTLDYLISRNGRDFTIIFELIKLKKDFEAFSSTDFTIDVSDTLKTIHIEHPSMDVVIAGNFDAWRAPLIRFLLKQVYGMIIFPGILWM